MRNLLFAVPLAVMVFGCGPDSKKTDRTASALNDSIMVQEKKPPFLWEAANVYFLLTDRFNNGNPENDVNFDRNQPTGTLRGFMGGDLEGITQKIEEGYFDRLGINAIWFSPIVEQIHGSVDEGQGNTYGYHGYWTRDWTALDPNFGTKKELGKLVKTAHEHGIRILMDVVLNHTGPVTDKDPVWPEDWVRTGPACTYKDYLGTTACTLVTNLPDIITETEQPVELPDALLAKWKEEDRLGHELDELESFFARTGYPRAPHYYIIKWLTDYVNDFGIDGFRVDTAKHVDEVVWSELFTEGTLALDNWKKQHPQEVMDATPFFMVGEVYGYSQANGRYYDFGDKKVDFFSCGFKSLINFGFKYDAKQGYDALFKQYSDQLASTLKDRSILNYLSSHDDMEPFDSIRQQPYKAANLLLMAPGMSQIYYGDETSRPLRIPEAQGDANLRSFMNWTDVDSLPLTRDILEHWQKLGTFRAKHPAIGAGRHQKLSDTPYVFSRTYVQGDFRDKVVVGLELPKGPKTLSVNGFFGNGTRLRDCYSQTEVVVANGQVVLDNGYTTALLEPLP